MTITFIKKVYADYKDKAIKQLNLSIIHKPKQGDTELYMVAIYGIKDLDIDRLAQVIAFEFNAGVMINGFTGVKQPKNAVENFSLWEIIKRNLIKK